MEQIKTGTIVKWYMRSRAGIFAAVFLMWMIFSCVYCLYTESFEPLGYSWLLCLYFAAIFLGVDFWRYYKRTRRLENWCRCAAALNEPSEVPQSMEDVLYRSCIRAILKERSAEAERYRAQALEDREYFTVWCHQIKTPIAAMRLLLGEENLPVCDEASGELFKIEEYVDMVLQYLRSDDQTSDYVLQDCDLEKIVRGVVRRYAPQFIRRKLRIDFRLQPVRVLTDEKWVSFIIGQLLSNALKYTKQGTISICQESGSPRRLVIEDTGIGIAPEDLPRVFERGYTGYNGRKDKRATGIGLYLSKRIADRLNHRIEISSVQGKGTKVVLDFGRDDMMFD